MAGAPLHWNAARGLLLTGVLGLGVALVQGGILTGIALGLSGSSSLRPAWTGSWMPSFPTQAGRVAWEHAAYGTVLWREYAQTLVLLPLLVGWLCSRSSPLAVRWLVGATLPGVLLTLYTRFPLNDFDTYRFYQLYFGAAMLASGLWLARRWQPRAGTASAAAGLGTPGRTRAVVLAALLCLQGVRVTVAQAVLIYPALPYRYEPGQVAALEAVAERGQVAEGILCQLPDLPFNIPPTPGVLGVPVAASDPGTDIQVQRGRAWQRALACPSPANLRTARTRWVCLEGGALAQALPLLEERPGFEALGVFGAAPRYRYRLYRYTGTWEEADHLLWRARGLERHSMYGAQVAGERLPTADLVRLADGDPDTATVLSSAALSGSAGLLLDLSGGQGGRPPWVSWVWVLAMKGGADFRAWGGLEVEVLVQGTEAGAPALSPSLTWVRVPSEATRVYFEAQKPRAWGCQFPPHPALAVRLRLAGKAASSSTQLEWAEVYAGRVEE